MWLGVREKTGAREGSKDMSDRIDSIDPRGAAWRMRLYLSGPMTGKEDFNRPEFDKWARKLREKGFEVSNPGELPPGLEWEEYMRIAKEKLAECHGIALLPGYLSSKGACMELRWALDAGLVYATVRNWQELLVTMSTHGGTLHEERGWQDAD